MKVTENFVQKVFETEWFSIDAVSHDSSSQPYYRLSCNDSVVIVAFTTDRKLIMVRQYRPAIEKSILEPPAGQVEKGETPEEAAKRELSEETGYECSRFILIGSYKAYPWRIHSTVYAYVGMDAILTCRNKKEKEIDVELLNEQEFKNAIISTPESVSISVHGFYYLAKLKGLF